MDSNSSPIMVLEVALCQQLCQPNHYLRIIQYSFRNAYITNTNKQVAIPEPFFQGVTYIEEQQNKKYRHQLPSPISIYLYSILSYLINGLQF